MIKIILSFLIINSQVVEIKRGYTLKKIARILKEKNIIKDPYIFMILAKLSGNEKKIQTGKYILEENLGELRTLIYLVKGEKRVKFIKVTIPEGKASYEIATILYEKCAIDTNEFIKKIKDTTFIKKLSRKYPLLENITCLEGFLYPSTYFFYYNQKAEAVIEKMVDEFFKKIDTSWFNRAKKLGYSFYDILKVASLVEKEAQIEREKPIIAAVFYNRLKKNYPLQANVTILYVLRKHKKWLSEKELNIESPYNTYKYKGLPPTPICNPSISSIKASLNPAKVPYLYFVAKWDGTHFFATTLKEHIRNRRKSIKILKQMKQKKKQ